MSEFEQIVKRFLADLFRWAMSPPRKPGEFTILVTGEESTGDGMRKNITDIAFPPLPEGNPDGVVTRRFMITTSDLSSVIFPEQDFPFDHPGVTGVKLAHGVEVVLSLSDIDGANNLSEPQEQLYIASDVTAPAKPGEFGLTVTGEVDEA